MVVRIKDNLIICRLDNGLLLRRSSPQDADALADFNSRIHSDEGPETPNQEVATWTRDLLTKPHPTFDSGDFTIVEEQASGKIVSSLNLISQTWSFAGVEFKVGRPELVGTLPEFRKRGLVRQQMEVVHQWSAGRGELVQAITGIPFYYRLFGYEMAMNLGGGRIGYPAHVPTLKEGENEPYTVRAARSDDLFFIAELNNQGSQRGLVSVVRDAALWQYELDGKSAGNVNRLVLCVIENTASERVGFLAHPPFSWSNGRMFALQAFELKPGISWAEVTPSVLRFIQSMGEKFAAALGKEPFGMLGLWLGEQHPVYNVVQHRAPRLRKPYAWYLRVADVPAFLRLVSPVLEKRLENSPFAGHSAELRITFYRDGLRLKLDKGRLAEIEAWKPEPFGHTGEAAFPGLTFLQLLFGYRSTAELSYAFADCWFNDDEIEQLLNALFPRQPSNLLPVS